VVPPPPPVAPAVPPLPDVVPPPPPVAPSRPPLPDGVPPPLAEAPAVSPPPEAASPWPPAAPGSVPPVAPEPSEAPPSPWSFTSRTSPEHPTAVAVARPATTRIDLCAIMIEKTFRVREIRRVPPSRPLRRRISRAPGLGRCTRSVRGAGSVLHFAQAHQLLAGGQTQRRVRVFSKKKGERVAGAAEIASAARFDGASEEAVLLG